MEILPTRLCATLLLVWCLQVSCTPGCDQTEFLHFNGTCVACPVCGPGEQLSEDCGFGDGGAGVCILCEEGKSFSADTGVAPCMRCTQCVLLNRVERAACAPTRDAHCGQCLPGYYELRSMTGEVELPCVPCHRHDTVHKECLLLTDPSSTGEHAVTVPRGHFQEPEEERVADKTFSMVLIGSATASLIFLTALLLWAYLLTAETFKLVPEYCPGSDGLLSAEGDLQCTPLSGLTDGLASNQSEASSKPPAPAQDLPRGLNSVCYEVHPPPSIVINVTTNIKPCSQTEEGVSQQGEINSCSSTEEMEKNLQTIWEVAQGQSIELLDYDSVQDLALLLDSAESRDVLVQLGRSLGVPPQVLTHLRSFEDLFQYLRTSTYTLLPQLALAAALLPCPQAVARIHRAVVKIAL